MKVRDIRLKHFKRFADQTFSFLDERGLPRDLVVLVGPNGCGKSTVLQAIAAVLGAAVRRIGSPSELVWPGFDLASAGRAWGSSAEASLTVSGLNGLGEVLLRLVADTLTIEVDGNVGGIRPDRPLEAHLGHLGYAKELAEGSGTALWYTEMRSLTSINLDDPAGGNATAVTLDLLRARMAQLQSFHSIVLQRRALRPGERDLYAELERRWASVFPGRGFEGISISDRPEKVMDQAPFFLLDPDGRPYELGEMSGAERAIFPLVFDFANWNIHNSVILIDELELHLHPPLQQALLRALPKLGHNNQFIVTTHSDYIADLVPAEAVIRVGEV